MSIPESVVLETHKVNVGAQKLNKPNFQRPKLPVNCFFSLLIVRRINLEPLS